MPPPPIRFFIRAFLKCSTREYAMRRTALLRAAYRSLIDRTDAAHGTVPIEVPALTGVDPEMRRWSLYELLEHNRLVNESITALTCQLALGQELSGAARMDPKNDVLPGPDIDASAVVRFEQTIEAHLESVARLPRLRGTTTAPHPLVGTFDAHMWHQMFAFHLALHLPQARRIVSGLGHAHP